MSHTHLLYPGAMLTNNDLDHPSYQPTYNTSFAAPAPAGVNGYPAGPGFNNYGPPPNPQPNPNYGYYNNPSLQSAPPAYAPYQLNGYPSNYGYPTPQQTQPQPQYQPQPQAPSNYGYPTPQPVARRPKTKNNGRNGKSSTSSESYTVSGNRVSGNKGDHNGVFNIGNKHARRDIDDDEED